MHREKIVWERERERTTAEKERSGREKNERKSKKLLARYWWSSCRSNVYIFLTYCRHLDWIHRSWGIFSFLFISLLLGIKNKLGQKVSRLYERKQILTGLFLMRNRSRWTLILCPPTTGLQSPIYSSSKKLDKAIVSNYDRKRGREPMKFIKISEFGTGTRVRNAICISSNADEVRGMTTYGSRYEIHTVFTLSFRSCNAFLLFI